MFSNLGLNLLYPLIYSHPHRVLILKNELTHCRWDTNFEVTAFSSADDQFFSGLWVAVVKVNAQPQLLSQLFPLQKNSADTRKKIWLTEEAFIRQKPIHFLKITEESWNFVVNCLVKVDFIILSFKCSWFRCR